MLALLTPTGIPISEALALKIDNINNDGLVIFGTKFKKDRLVPLHMSTIHALETYMKYRINYTAESPALFVSNKGIRLPYSSVVTVFLQLIRSIGLRNLRDAGGALAYMIYIIHL
jgi:site-specific recombinase XerD